MLGTQPNKQLTVVLFVLSAAKVSHMLLTAVSHGLLVLTAAVFSGAGGMSGQGLQQSGQWQPYVWCRGLYPRWAAPALAGNPP